jgi:hypothetical protein
MSLTTGIRTVRIDHATSHTEPWDEWQASGDAKRWEPKTAD